MKAPTSRKSRGYIQFAYTAPCHLCHCVDAHTAPLDERAVGAVVGFCNSFNCTVLPRAVELLREMLANRLDDV